MKLDVIVDERNYSVDVPPAMLREAEEFFRKIDKDMDHGWQMGPEFIEKPDNVQRCQIAANKLLTSLSGANETMIMLMAGYILKRLPGVTGVRIDTAGEMLHTEMIYDKPAARPPLTAAPQPSPLSRKLGKLEAMEQAGKDITSISGRQELSLCGARPAHRRVARIGADGHRAGSVRKKNAGVQTPPG